MGDRSLTRRMRHILAILVPALALGIPAPPVRALEFKKLEGIARPAAPALPQVRPATWVLDRPIDAEAYRLGPGDLVGLFAHNVERTREEHLVESDGRLELPGLGRVPAAGLSLAELRRRAAPRLGHLFACDSVDLWIAQPRRIRVQVAGHGLEPNWLELDYQSRLSAILADKPAAMPAADPHAALPSLLKEPAAADSLSWRNVTIVREGGELSVDLLHHLRAGDLADNPVLEGGDRVVWGRRGLEVEAWGPFRHGEGPQEFRPGDTPARLATLLGGPRPGLREPRYEVVRPGPDGRVAARWELLATDPDFGTLALAPHDRLYLRADGLEDAGAQAEVAGRVLRPGRYAIEPGRTTLADLLAWARPDSATADLARPRLSRRPGHDAEARFVGEVMQLAELNRFERDYLKSRILHEGGRVSLPYDAAWFDPAQVLVQDGDRLELPRRDLDVEVLGAVLRPGRTSWRAGWSARDYVEHAGGKLRGANLAELRLRRAGADQFGPVPRGYRPQPGDVLMLMYREELTAWQKFKEGIGVMAQILTVVLVARTI